MFSHDIVAHPHEESQLDPATFEPRLLHGETSHGFVTVEYLAERFKNENFRRKHSSRVALRDAMSVLRSIFLPNLLISA
jgi:hypothetical protein